MGVSLERVQNKFACIIGELCSEPIVLSQFAVWVDLRIAEYKTNGTISLDCSGDSPNPIWMKGVKTAPQRGSSNSMDTGQGHHRRRGSYTNSPSLQSPSASPLSNQMYNERLPSADNQNSSSVFPSRLSPEIVVIKEEPSSDPSSCSLSRKRQSEGDLQSDYYSPAKSRRHGNASFSSPAQESSSNQSLMSIINTETDTITVEPVKNEDDIFKVTMEMQDELNQSQGLPPITSSNSTFSPRRPSATATSTSNSPNQSAWPTSYVNDPQQGTSSQAAFQTPIVDRKETVTGKSSKRHALGAIRAFRDWLIVAKADRRQIGTIKMEELDPLLGEFFLNIKRKDGSDYSVNSLTSLRTGISFSFRMTGISEVGITGKAFPKACAGFRERRRILMLLEKSVFQTYM